MPCPRWCQRHGDEPATHASREILLDDPAILIVAWLTAPIDAPDLAELRIESDGGFGDGQLLDVAHAHRLAEASERFGRQLREVVA